MRRPAESSWLASLLVPVLLLSCTTDDTVVFEPGVEELTMPGVGLSSHNRCPTLSEDARVLAWVHVELALPDNHYHVLHWQRPAPIDTLLSTRQRIDYVDLSADGERLVGLITKSDPIQFFVWSHGDETGVQTFDLPADYSTVRTPQWADETSVLFGALGPEGQGVWCWSLTEGTITPICVRFPTLQQQWRGTHPGLDQSGERICFERNAGELHIQVTICRPGSTEILRSISGNIPRFWSITPAEEDGLLYIDSHRFLRGLRLSTNETFYIVQEVISYDISSDGQWLFTEGSDLMLRLRELRNPR